MNVEDDFVERRFGAGRVAIRLILGRRRATMIPILKKGSTPWRNNLQPVALEELE